MRKNISFLAIMALFVSGCSPMIQKVSDFDVNAGYVKSVEFKVEDRLAKHISHEAKFYLKEGNELPSQVIKDEKGRVRAIAIESKILKEHDTLEYTLITNYKWPLLGVRKQKQTQGHIVVIKPAKLVADVSSMCLEIGQSHVLSLHLSPTPVHDRLTISTKLAGVHMDVSTSYDKDNKSRFYINTLGKKLGNASVTSNVGRANIEPVSITYKIVPSFQPPSGMLTRKLMPSDNQNPPADVDHDTDEPIVLVWNNKIGARRYTVQVFDTNENRVLGSLVDSGNSSYVAWLPVGKYSWKIRVEVDTCSNSKQWTSFSDSLSFTVK